MINIADMCLLEDNRDRYKIRYHIAATIAASEFATICWLAYALLTR